MRDDGRAVESVAEKRVRVFLTIALAAVVIPACQAQESRPVNCSPEYQNHNMVDYGPLVLRGLSGRALDPSAVPIPEVCLGIFTDDSHRKLVASTLTDQQGNFAVRKLSPGKYRLVAQCNGFCAANVPLRIARWPSGGLNRHLVLHMNVRTIDGCSFGGYK